ncbi:MAG: LacI family DNA-binding transcriptional regulator [Oscillospiraceae bacterium]|nr:LacI family DNA-binding transcriptional regulator [Oscillospiraceae bacterium]
MKKRVTMRDIADKLGITAAAVSKAFTGNGSISDELRNKVINTANDMGYCYEANAHKKKSLSNNIGIIVAERYISDNSFYFKFIRGISSSLQRHGNYAFFHTLSRYNEEKNILPDIFTTQRVDGIIILGQISDEYTKTVLKTLIPVVFLDFYNELTANSCIVCDGFYATYEMTNSLIRKGHRKIAFVGNIHSTSSIQDRYLGYAKSLIEHNIPLNDYYCISDRNTEDGKFIPIELPVIMPTAFVCNCDEIACKLIGQLNNSGFRVPDDISVTGFDNSVYSSICSPNITTVEVNTEQMAAIAVDTLLTKIKMPSQQTGMIQVKGKIINKDSVKAIDNEAK